MPGSFVGLPISRYAARHAWSRGPDGTHGATGGVRIPDLKKIPQAFPRPKAPRTRTGSFELAWLRRRKFVVGPPGCDPGHDLIAGHAHSRCARTPATAAGLPRRRGLRSRWWKSDIAIASATMPAASWPRSATRIFKPLVGVCVEVQSTANSAHMIKVPQVLAVVQKSGGLRLRLTPYGIAATSPPPPFLSRRALPAAETAVRAGVFRHRRQHCCPTFPHQEQCAMNAIDRSLYRDTRSDQRAIELETRYSAPNYAPLPVVLTRGEGSHLWDTAGRALRRHDERLFGGEPRPRASAHPRGARRAGAPPRGAVARLLQRPARAVPRRALPAHRARCRAADEHRRRGGRDRHQGGAPLGLSRQGHRQGPAPRSSSPTATSTAAPPPSSRFRPSPTTATASARSRRASGGAVRRPRRGRARDHARHRGRADRADPGRGRHRRAARRLSRRAAPAVRRAQRAAHPRRGAVGARPHRRAGSPSSTRASGRTASSSARRWAAACCRCRRSSARAS